MLNKIDECNQIKIKFVFYNGCSFLAFLGFSTYTQFIIKRNKNEILVMILNNNFQQVCRHSYWNQLFTSPDRHLYESEFL